MSDYYTEQLTRVRAEVAALRRDRVTYRTAQVTSVNTGSGTFDADASGAGQLAGIPAEPQFMPAVGDQVRLSLSGATPIYQPARIAEDAITGREIASGAVVEDSVFDGAIGSSKLKDLAVITAKIGDLAVNSAKIGSVEVGKLVAGTMTADVTISGRFATALTGTRTEVNALGFQAWNGATQTVSLTGVENLLTGTFKTSASGRRIELLSSGNTGRASFFAPDGTVGLVESLTEPSTGFETIRVAMPLQAADWTGWNGIQFQTNDRAYLSTGYMLVTYGGGGTGTQAFEIHQASTKGGPTSQPDRVLRFDLDPGRSAMIGPEGSSSFEAQSNALRLFVGGEEFEGSIDVLRHGIADTALRSPKLLFRAEGGGHGHHLRFVVDSDLSNPRLEVTNTADSGYGSIRAAAFTVSSSSDGKDEIADLSGSALARVKTMRPRTYRRTSGGQRGPLEIGLVAQEAPSEVVVGDNEAVNLYALSVLNVGAINELDAKLTALLKRLGVAL